MVQSLHTDNDDLKYELKNKDFKITQLETNINRRVWMKFRQRGVVEDLPRKPSPKKINELDDAKKKFTTSENQKLGL